LRSSRRGLVLERQIRRFVLFVVLAAWVSTLAPAAAHAAFPGANGRIVFDTAELFFTGTGSSQIYSARHDGSDVRPLTSVPEGSSAWNPRVSADGDRILYVLSADGENDQLWLMRSDGSNQHPLLEEPDWQQEAGSFTPAGRIVYSRCGSYVPAYFTCHLVSVRPDGSDRRTLVGGTWHPTDPVVASDGTIAYLGDKGGYDPRIWLIDHDGTNPHPVGPTFGIGRISWSPDASHLAFDGNFHDHPIGVYTIARDGSDLERIAGQVAFPTWSPNGAWILFRSERSGSFGTLLRARADGTGVTALVRSDSIGMSDWAVAR
jgi:Tol biopolymer transport system component